MDQLSNIIGMQGSKAAAAQAPRAKTSSASDTQAFMKALNAKLAQMKGTQKLQAKLAEVDRKPAAEKNAIMDKLQATNPKNDDELLRNLSALLGNTQDVKPALTSDLASSLSLSLQADANDDAMLTQLTELFQNGTQDIAQFRDQAIETMQNAGMDPASIERMLVKLSSALGGQITVEQQTALMMPLDGDASPKTAQAAQPDTTKYMAAHKAEDGYTPAAKDMPASQPAPQTQDAQAAAPKSQPAQQAGAHLSLINSFAAEGGDTSGGFTGQGFSQSSYNNMPGMTAGTAATQNASGTPGSFVNYMGSASSAQTTQSIALQIQRNAQTQVDTFRMQLHPADLGQLEVRLKFSKDGGMKAHLVADKPETLALLQKDSAQLQKMLEQSGLQMDGSSLSFDLRQQREQNASGYEGNAKPSRAGGDDDAEPSQAANVQANISVEAMGTIRQGGINIMV